MQILLKRLNGVMDTFDIPENFTHAQLYQFVAERHHLPAGSFLLHKGNRNVPNDSNPVQEDGVIYLLMHATPYAGGRRSRSRRSRSKSKSKREKRSKSRTRGDALAAVMRSKSMTLGAASAYVKRHGLW